MYMPIAMLSTNASADCIVTGINDFLGLCGWFSQPTSKMLGMITFVSKSRC